MLILQKLEDMSTLSSNEKVVAKYLISHKLEINKISINDIAKTTYTSPSTTVRLAKKLGYDGWKELKREIVDELKYINDHYQNIDPNFPFHKEDNETIISKNIGNLQTEIEANGYSLIIYEYTSEQTGTLSIGNYFGNYTISEWYIIRA